MTCTASRLAQTIASLPGGMVRHGGHPSSADCCILEAVAVCRGMPKTDNPLALDLPDVRPLNDGPWHDDMQRTAGMLLLAPLLEAWPMWTPEQRSAFVRAVAIRTVAEILPPVLRSAGHDEHADRCASARTLQEARSAAHATDAACSAAYAACSAARAATDAARAAAYAAANAARAATDAAYSAATAADILILACRIWAEEAGKIGGVG